MELKKFFKSDERHVIIRTLLPLLPVFLMLFAFDFFTSLNILRIVGATALGSSTANIIIDPKSPTNSPRHLIGGYVIGCIVGITCYYLSQGMGILFPGTIPMDYHAVFGAVAVALSVFFMLSLRAIHATAAGFSLALVIEKWDPLTLTIIFAYVIVLAILRHFLWPRLSNLI